MMTQSSPQKQSQAQQSSSPANCVQTKVLLRGTFDWEAQDAFIGGTCGGFVVPFSPYNATIGNPPTPSIQFSPNTPSSAPINTSSGRSNKSGHKKKRKSLAQRVVAALCAPPLPLEEGNITLGLGAPRPSVLQPSTQTNSTKTKTKKMRRVDSVATRDSCATDTTAQSAISITSSARLPRSSLMMLSDKFSFMSYRFPVTQGTTKLTLRKRKLPATKNSQFRDIDIEDMDGKVVGTIEDGAVTGDPDIRRLKDVTGRPCAIIKRCFDPSILYGPKICFRVYGDKPCTYGQERVSDDIVFGTYLWAEIKNVGSIDGTKFVMKRYSTKTDSCSEQEHTTKRFGSLFSTKRKGYTIMDHEGKECLKIVALKKNRNKGIAIGPNRDMCLMLAFCAVVDEFVEHRLI